MPCRPETIQSPETADDAVIPNLRAAVEEVAGGTQLLPVLFGDLLPVGRPELKPSRFATSLQLLWLLLSTACGRQSPDTPAREAPLSDPETITVDSIRSAPSDRALFKELTAELNRRASAAPEHSDLDAQVAWLQSLPRGLRAMAATHQLDVSMALDDLGWHFGNWHHVGLANETLAALRELEAVEAAAVFEKAFELAQSHWDELDDSSWTEWYGDSELEAALSSLNKQMWAICERSQEFGLMSYWIEYARRYPERVAPPRPGE